MRGTGIAWADDTFNPWWGCARVSPACTNCYAESFAGGLAGYSGKPGKKPLLWGKTAERRTFGRKHWDEPLEWDAEAEAAGHPRLVFCASMADVFEPREDLDAERAKLWSLIEVTPHLIWLLLTKRPEEIRRRVPERWMSMCIDGSLSWPSNVWVGTTVESQRYAEERLPELLEIPAPVHFASCEPLLEEITLEPWLTRRWEGVGLTGIGQDLPRLDWVIVGGETGGRNVRRPFDNQWARRLRVECATHDAAFFYKQDAGLHPGTPGPEDLAIQEFPSAARRPPSEGVPVHVQVDS